MFIIRFSFCDSRTSNEVSLIPGSASLVYDSSVQPRLAILLIVSGALLSSAGWSQETAKPDPPSSEPKSSEPKYDETFSGPIVEVSATKITVSRSILGKPAEKRTFSIKPDTRIEGKLRVRAKVTVGFVTTDDGEDVARLVVVRPAQKQPDKK
jgi:hypothetical protein